MFNVGDPEFDARLLSVLANEKVEYLARHLARDAGQIRNPLDEREFDRVPDDVKYVCRKMAVEYAEILDINWSGEDGTEQPGEERSEPGAPRLG